MFEKKEYEGILVYEEGNTVYARNENGRVLFRFNKTSQRFGTFRSSRMTDEEKRFCILMLERFVPSATEDDKVNCMRFMNYEIDANIYCS